MGDFRSGVISRNVESDVRWNEQSDFLDDVLRLCVIVVQYAKSKPSVTKRRQLPHVFHNRNMTALKPTFRPLLYQLRCPCTLQVAYSGSGGNDPFFNILGNRWKQVVNLTLRPLYPGERNVVSGRFWRAATDLLPHVATLSCLSSHYID